MTNASQPQTTPARTLLALLKSTTALKAMTPVSGDGIPPGLYVKALTFGERLEIESVAPIIEAAWERMRGSAGDPEGLAAEKMYVGISLTLAHAVVAEDGVKPFLEAEAVPEDWKSLQEVESLQHSTTPGETIKIDSSLRPVVDKHWIAVCNLMEYIVPPAMIKLLKVARETGYERDASLGKGSQTAAAPAS